MVKKNASLALQGAELEVKIDVTHKSRILSIKNHFIAMAEDQKEDIRYKYYPRHYYDTRELALHHHGYSWRLQREKHKGYKQTIKYELESDHPLEKGEVYRMEKANMNKGARPEFDSITDLEVRRRMQPFRNEPMIYVGTADFERDYFDLTVGKGADKGVVELAFDIGQYEISGSEDPFYRYKIEIELKKGNRKALDTVRDLILSFSSVASGAPDVTLDTYKSKSDEITSLYRRVNQKHPHGSPV